MKYYTSHLSDGHTQTHPRMFRSREVANPRLPKDQDVTWICCLNKAVFEAPVDDFKGYMEILSVLHAAQTFVNPLMQRVKHKNRGKLVISSFSPTTSSCALENQSVSAADCLI